MNHVVIAENSYIVLIEQVSSKRNIFAIPNIYNKIDFFCCPSWFPNNATREDNVLL